MPRNVNLKALKKIDQELKKPLYDDYLNDERCQIEGKLSDALYRFLDDLSNELIFDSINVEKYNELIRRHFSSDDIEFTPTEVFNYYVYEDEGELQTEAVKRKIAELVEQSISFISLDPKRLTVMIIKTHNDRAIRGLLNQLFTRNRSNKWNSYDTTIAISYLIYSEFKHADLLKVLSCRSPRLYDYYKYNCKNSTIKYFACPQTNELCNVIEEDNKAQYLYFMHLCEKKRANYMPAFAYYKNFFDRVTADLNFKFEHDLRLNAPNYKVFYKENELKKFYSEIDNSEYVIKNAHKLRNANPLSHASAELLDKDSTSRDLCNSINSLSRLIYEYINKHTKPL